MKAARFPLLFWMAMEDGVLVFVANEESNVDFDLLRMDICDVYLTASAASACLRS